MPDSPGSAWIWERFDRMAAVTAEQHQRLRNDMNLIADRINERLGRIEEQVTIIKTERRKEEEDRLSSERRMSRNIAVYSILSGAVMSMVLKVFEFWMHKP